MYYNYYCASLITISLWFCKISNANRNKIVVQESSNNNIVKCAENIFSAYHLRHGLLVTEKGEEINKIWNTTGSITKITFSGTISLFSKLPFTEFFIIFLENLDQFKIWLNQSINYKFWNPRAKFIVIVKQIEMLVQIFEIAWDYYILNINALLLVNNTVDVYTYFPFNNKNCKPNLMPKMVQFAVDKNDNNMYPYKVPHNLQACKINMLAIIIPPYVMNPWKDPTCPGVSGIEVTILHVIAKQLNFTENYLKHDWKNWGFRLPNGTYTGLYTYLLTRKADLFFGLAPSEFNEFFDMSLPSLMEETPWWVPAARPEPAWKNLKRIYQNSLWISILTTLGLTTFLWCLIGKKEYKQRFICFLICWSVLLQTAAKLPKSLAMKILFISWVLFSLVLCISYQSQLISILTNPFYEHQISNVQELLESKLLYGFFPRVIQSFFNDPKDPIQKRIADNFITCPLTEECVNRTAFQRNFAVVKSLRHVRFLTKKYYLDPNGRSLLYDFKKGTLYQSVYVCRKGFPFLRHINRMLLLLQANGLIDKWDNDIRHAGKVRQEKQLYPLSIMHLSGGFACLLIGYILAIFVFVIENLYRRK